MNDGPWLHVIAGPNGAGKSTLAETLREQDRFRGTEFVNADAIAARLSPGTPERAAILARDESMRQVRARLAEGKDVAIETNLSGNSKLRLMDEARAHGLKVNLVYVGLESPDRALDRVDGRVAAGGHGIPPSEVVRRYGASLQNLARVLPEVDRAEVYDNSGTRHTRVLTVEHGVVRQASDPQPEWLIRTLGAEMRPGQGIAQPRGTESPDPAMRRIREDVSRLEQRIGLERLQVEAGDVYRAAERTISDGGHRERRAAAVSDALDRSLAAVYRDPESARAAIEQRAAKEGAENALAEMERNPKTYGELRGRPMVGSLVLEGSGRDQALRAVPEAIRAGREHFALRAEVQRQAPVLEEARRALAEAGERVRQLGAELTRLPGRAELTRSVGEGMRNLAPDRAGNLVRSLPQAQKILLNQAVQSLGREGDGLEL